MRIRPMVPVLSAALIVGGWSMGPALLHPATQVPNTNFTLGHLAATELGRELIRDGTILSLHTNRAAWPAGARFVPLMWPLSIAALVVGPIVAVNLAWALAPAFDAACTYALGRVLGARPTGAALAAALATWTPWVRTTLGNGQVEQAVTGIIALTWTVGLLATRRPWWLLAVPGVVVAGGLAAPSLELAALLGLGLVAAVDLHRQRLVAWLGVLLAAAGGGLIVNAVEALNFTGGPNVFRPRQAGDDLLLSDATLHSLFVPPDHTAFAQSTAHVPYLGLALVAAALLAAASSRHARRFLLVAAGMAVFSLGAWRYFGGVRLPLPLAAVSALAPILSHSASAYRLASAAGVALAVTAGLGLDPGHARRPCLVFVAGLALAALSWTETGLVQGRHLPLPARPAIAHPELAALRGGSGPVLDLPLLYPRLGHPGPLPQHYFNAILVHDRPLLHTAMDAHYPAGGDRVASIAAALRSPICHMLLPVALRNAGIGAVVFHNHFSDHHPEGCLVRALGPGHAGRGLTWWDLQPGDQKPASASAGSAVRSRSQSSGSSAR